MRSGTTFPGWEAGFTLAELLVVILIVGILAAIAVPTLLSQRERGVDSAAKGAASTVARAMAIYHDDNDDSYACGSSVQCLAEVRAIEPNIPTTGILFTSAGGFTGTPTNGGYRVTVTGGQGRTYWVEHSASGADRGCAVNGAPTHGGCNAGSW